MKRLLSLLVVGTLSLGLVACSSTATTEGSKEVTKVEQTNETKPYKVGDVVTIKKDGKDIYSYSIDKITVTEERNEYADTKPKQVIDIEYTYTNIDYPEGMLFLDETFAYKFMSASGEVGYSYPSPSLSKYPTEAPKGATVHAQMCIGFEEATDQVKILQYDNLLDSKETSIVTSELK